MRRLKELRAEGKSPGHTRSANEKRGRKVAKEAAARAAWNERGTKEVDPQQFRTSIAPMLEQHSVREIVAMTGLSLRYSALIRKGERIPHPRHWQALARLVAQD